LIEKADGSAAPLSAPKSAQYKRKKRRLTGEDRRIGAVMPSSCKRTCIHLYEVDNSSNVYIMLREPTQHSSCLAEDGSRRARMLSRLTDGRSIQWVSKADCRIANARFEARLAVEDVAWLGSVLCR
jgi:hypothetical protein